ncbi:MAG: hypothetical protein Q4G43_05800 [Mobilicoccus sp.]|nr:hypothetical protein [Mobilicoccus sp.]
MPMTGVPVGGIDLGDVSPALAERVGATLVATAHRLDIDADALVVGGHQIIGRGGVLDRVLTLAGEGIDLADLRLLCTTVLAETPEACAVAVGQLATGAAPAVEAVRSALHERLLRIGGQALAFPGMDRLIGTLSVTEILDRSAIEAVSEVAGEPLDGCDEVVTGPGVRPRWSFGPLTLHVQPHGDGLYVPFEWAPPVHA